MRYHIDTIPVWDAFKEGGECPLCSLRMKNEQDYLESFLGASVMEPDTRVEVNAKGFCSRHFSQMFVMKNRLGPSLMTHTHLKETMQNLSKPEPNRRSIFKRREVSKLSEGSCILCERLDYTMDRYAYTVLHLWKTDVEFRKKLESSMGLCLPHYHQLMKMASEELSEKEAEAFMSMLEKLEMENLERIEKELEWFTLKFDYRNADKPWGNSKDAPERAINKLRGRCVGETENK